MFLFAAFAKILAIFAVEAFDQSLISSETQS
jgi:hypothetical protein